MQKTIREILEAHGVQNANPSHMMVTNQKESARFYLVFENDVHVAWVQIDANVTPKERRLRDDGSFVLQLRVYDDKKRIVDETIPMEHEHAAAQVKRVVWFADAAARSGHSEHEGGVTRIFNTANIRF